MLKKILYVLIVLGIFLILFGVGYQIYQNNVNKYKSKINDFGTIKTEKVSQGDIIYFYPNFEVKKNDSKKYFTLSLYYKNNVMYQKTFIVWYIDGEKNNRYFVSQGLSDEGLKYIKNYKIRIAKNPEIKEFNKKYGIK